MTRHPASPSTHRSGEGCAALRWLGAAALLLASPLSAAVNDAPEAPPLDPPPEAREQAGPKRIYRAVRCTGAAPVIDGRLDDPAWQAGEWAGGYVQREPFEGRGPTAPTFLKILFDDRAVYVAIRAVDPEMRSQAPLLGNRDEFAGDMVGVAFDSYFGKRTAFEFDVTSGGSKVDLILKNDGSIDLSWNAIWEVKVDVTDEGWTAEYRIPLSQLRYGRGRDLVWGLHAWRRIKRVNEESNWKLIPQDNPGTVYSFGELHGISGLPRSRRIEVVPYASIKYEALRREAGNPYRDGGEFEFNGGFDAKVGLTSDFTLDATINPDFGQVEADPSEINLGTQETRRSERRPFFLEGRNIFELGLDDDAFFYSRRIGHAPSLVPNTTGFVDVPENTRIFSALKVTGRTPGGFSLGLLHSLAERAEARIFEASTGERSEMVEPQTHFLVARMQGELNQGNTVLGGIFTGTARDPEGDAMVTLPDHGVLAGLDGQHFWNERAYFVEARGVVTEVRGSAASIEALATNAVHYFQRPDADHLELEEGARTLSGNAGRVRAGKGSGGKWRYHGGITWRSPGVDFNDAGYLRAADLIERSAQLQYVGTEPGRFLKRENVRLKLYDREDYGGLGLGQEVQLESDLSSVGSAYLWSRLTYRHDRVDTRMLRGGPALKRPDSAGVDLYFETDGSRPTQWSLDGGYWPGWEERSRYWRIAPGVAHRLSPRVLASAEVKFERNRQFSQYAGEGVSAAGPRYLVGRMEQHTLASELRLDVNFSPTASLSYFGGPFASTGRFREFQRVARPLAETAGERYAPVSAVAQADGSYAVADADGAYAFDDPDFSWRELRSNLVFRWEYRPGSTVYCVWSQHREDARSFGEFGGASEYSRLMDVGPSNTFMVKVSYWFSI